MPTDELSASPLFPRELALGLLRRGDQILMMDGFDRVKQERFYRPLGGAVEEGETPEEAVVREMLEELGLGVRVLRNLGDIENRFVYEGKPGWELVHVFEVESTERIDAPIAPLEPHLRIAWVDAKDPDSPIYPEGLSSLLSSN